MHPFTASLIFPILLYDTDPELFSRTLSHYTRVTNSLYLNEFTVSPFPIATRKSFKLDCHWSNPNVRTRLIFLLWSMVNINDNIHIKIQNFSIFVPNFLTFSTSLLTLNSKKSINSIVNIETLKLQNVFLVSHLNLFHLWYILYDLISSKKKIKKNSISMEQHLG